MKYATPAAFRAALEQRLRTAAQQTGLSIVRLRKLVVFDRLMARLLLVAPNRWLLKGALALSLRFGTLARSTKDMDLARNDHEEAATADLLAAQSVDLGDFFTFTIQKTTGLQPILEGVAARYHVSAELAGRRFDDVIVDIGFGDPLVGDPDVLQGPDLLTFAGISSIAVPTIPLELHIAEKVHAYTRVHSGQRPSSRVKDLLDVVLIRSLVAFDADRLQRAFAAVFDGRNTHPLPTRLPPPPSDWGPAYRTMAREVGLHPDVLIGYELAASFLDPILSGAVPEGARWDPECARW